MPGLFGSSGGDPQVLERLRSGFEEIWDPIAWEAVDRGGLGSHSFDRPAIHRSSSGTVTAWDGEARIYRDPPIDPAVPPTGGSVARLAPEGTVTLRADEAGIFPLFFATIPDGMAFCTHLRPLAKAVAAARDPVGIAEFVRFACTYGGRTFFQGISRLQPGQLLTWRPGDSIQLRETSRLWVGPHTGGGSVEEVAEEAQSLLVRSLRETLPTEGTSVLMMSAGWDSRTLLGGALECRGASSVACYSHGDLRSRELAISRDLSEAAGVPWQGRAIDADVWDHEHLQLTFDRTETLIFPHWSWAGRLSAGCSSIFSGVLGEVIGGHYGSTHVARGVGKVGAFLRERRGRQSRGMTSSDVSAHLHLRHLESPWYLTPEVEPDPTELVQLINNDISIDLNRLTDRGIQHPARLLEAFVAEHRGVQYICGQALSARVSMEIAVPYADPALLGFASRVPPHLKVHNALNRKLATRMAPDLAPFPMAATLVPSTSPILVQEGSRVVRRLYEGLRWWGYARSEGRLPRPHLGWVDFEFLRNGELITTIIDGLRSDLWNRQAMLTMVDDFRSFRRSESLHPFFDQMGKILTIDRMLA